MRFKFGCYQFSVDLGDLFREISGYIWIEKHEFFVYLSRLLFLMIWGSESGCLGSEIKQLARKVLQKSAFAEIGFLMFPGINFHDFCCPGAWLEI